MSSKLGLLYSSLPQEQKNGNIVAHQADSDVLMVKQLMTYHYQKRSTLVEAIKQAMNRKQMPKAKNMKKSTPHCNCTTGNNFSVQNLTS